MLNILNGYSWDPHSDTKILIYMNMLVMLSAMSQEQFIYHMDKGKGPFTPSVSVCDDASDTVLTENSEEWGLQPFLSNSIVFNKNKQYH